MAADMAATAEQLANLLSSCDEETMTSIITGVLQARPEVAPAIVDFACPDLTYGPAKSMAERRAVGHIKSFSPESGFGFIQCPELRAVFGNDVFVHGKQCDPNIFSVGSQVTFAVCLSKDSKPQAFDLQFMGGGGGGGFKGGGKGDMWGKGGGKGDMWAMWDPSDPFGKGQMGWGGDGFGGGDKGCGGKGKKRGPPQEEQQIEGRFAGVIKSFNEKSGYGFIECPDLKAAGYQNDAFLNRQQLQAFQVGSQVSFEVFVNQKGQPVAKNLEGL